MVTENFTLPKGCVLYNRRKRSLFIDPFLISWSYNKTMWKSILSKVNAALLTWEGTKGTGAAILGGAESVLDAGYQGAKAVGSAALGTVEGAVEGVVEDATKAATIVTGEKK